MRGLAYAVISVAMAATLSPRAHASAFTTYSDATSFQAALASSFTDDYTNPGYANGDVISLPGLNIFTDAAMSAVVGQTQYTSTTNLDANDIGGTPVTYCSGCNGSFLLTFTSTSFGNSSGVFGVGFDYQQQGMDALATFGDGSTEDFSLQSGNDFSFFGITSDLEIRSIYFGHDGVADDGTVSSRIVELSDLTIGSAPATAIPEPPDIFLFASALGAFALIGLGRGERRAIRDLLP
jgi:hypothetical protein